MSVFSWFVPRPRYSHALLNQCSASWARTTSFLFRHRGKLWAKNDFTSPNRLPFLPSVAWCCPRFDVDFVKIPPSDLQVLFDFVKNIVLHSWCGSTESIVIFELPAHSVLKIHDFTLTTHTRMMKVDPTRAQLLSQVLRVEIPRTIFHNCCGR